MVMPNTTMGTDLSISIIKVSYDQSATESWPCLQTQNRHQGCCQWTLGQKHKDQGTVTSCPTRLGFNGPDLHTSPPS